MSTSELVGVVGLCSIPLWFVIGLTIGHVLNRRDERRGL